MNIGVLGTGVVGQSLATKLTELGHTVTMGARRADNETARQWTESGHENARQGTFADAAALGELVVNCTAGAASLAALEAAGEENLSGKVLLDVANPLDFSRGMPPRLSVATPTASASRSSAAFPRHASSRRSTRSTTR